MPILDVQLIGSVTESDRATLARRIADAAGAVFTSRPQQTWVTLRFVPDDAYSENGGGPPGGVRPVIVSILHSNPPTGDALTDQVARLTQAIARACGRPAESVHLIYQPLAKGRVAFGGRLVD